VATRSPVRRRLLNMAITDSTPSDTASSVGTALIRHSLRSPRSDRVVGAGPTRVSAYLHYPAVASARRSAAVSDSGSPQERRGARQFVFPSYVLLDRKPQNRSVQILCSPALAYALTRSVSSVAGADMLRAKGQGTTSQSSHAHLHHPIELSFDRVFRACGVARVGLPRSFHQRAFLWKG